MVKDCIKKELNGKNYNCHRESDGRFSFAYVMLYNDKATPIIISSDFLNEPLKNKTFVTAGVRHFKKTAGVAVYIKAYDENERPIWVLYDTCNVKDKSFLAKELDYNFNKRIQDK